MENQVTDEPVAIKVEVCGDTGDMYMNSAYEGTDPADDAYEPRSATDDTTDQAIANNHMDSAYKGKESVDDNTNQAITNHSSSCEFEKCERLKSVYIVNEPYTCGGCERLFSSICLLHEHIGIHGLGGSYHYNHKSRTAFPKYDNICCMNHTFDTNIGVVSDTFQVTDSASYEISGNGPKIGNISNSERATEKEEVESNKASHDTMSLQGMSAGGSEKLRNSDVNNTSCVYVTAEKDNDSSVHDKLYEARDSSTDELSGNKLEFQSSSYDDGAVADKLPLKRKSECLYTSRGENGRFKKKIPSKRKSAKQKELCSDQEPELFVKEESDNDTSLIKLPPNDSQSPKITEFEPEFLNCTCFRCKLVFQSESVLKSHLEKHEGRLVCDCCSASFPTLTEFEKHVLYGEGKAMKAVDILYCSYCNMMFTEIKGLKAHICVSANDLRRKRKAIRSGTGTTNKKKQVLQYIPLHGVKSLQQLKSEETMNNSAKIECEVCNEKFENDYFLIMHKTVHTHPYKCSKCSLYYISEFDRDQHSTSCIDLDSYYACHICGKHVKTKNSLGNHIDTHKETKDLQCSRCGAVFKTKWNLVSHEKCCPALTNREKKFSCEKCGSKFYDKKYLKIHMRTVHSEVRSFVCEICGAAFKGNGVLRRHKETHKEDKKKFTCNICGVGFTQRMSLKRHSKIHLQQSMEQCTYCGKTFREPWNLKAHVRQHTGEKPYKCESCGQGFTHNVSKKAHMKHCYKTLN